MNNIKNIVKYESIIFKNIELNNIIELFSIWYNSDDIIVHGYILQKKNLNEKIPVIIYCRGGNNIDMKGNYKAGEICPKSILHNDEYLYQMATKGIAIIFFPNYRGSTESEGQDEFGGKDVNDIINLYPIMQEYEYCDINKIALIGRSRGCMMAVLTSIKVNWVKIIILIAGVYSILRNMKERPEMVDFLMNDFNLSKNNIKERCIKHNIDKIPKNISILILHGSADNRVNVSHAYSIGKKCQKNNLSYKLIIFPNGNHGLIQYKDDVSREIIEWLKKYF